MALKLLALDTSTLAGSVAVVEGEALLAETLLELPRKHSERLVPSIEFILSQLGLEPRELNGLAVGLGPGSFTGLRVGLAAMKGLALALQIPLVGVDSLEALAQNLAAVSGQLAPTLDARKGQVFLGLFLADGKNPPVRLHDNRSLEPEAAAELISEPTLFFGDGARVYRDRLVSALGEKARFAPPGYDQPRAYQVARLALPRLQQGRADDPDALVPNYVRLSDAERVRPGN